MMTMRFAMIAAGFAVGLTRMWIEAADSPLIWRKLPPPLDAGDRNRLLTGA